MHASYLHGNIHDLIVTCRQFDISFRFETLPPGVRHGAELLVLIQTFKRISLIKLNVNNKAQGLATCTRS